MEPGRLGMSWIVELTHSIHFPIATRSMGRGKKGVRKMMGLPLLGWFRYDLYDE